MVGATKCIFLCHASEDRELARALDKGLRLAGYTTWMAPRDANPTVDYALEILRGIEDCDEVLVVGTDAAYRSGHVIREADLALKGSKAIRPLIIDEPTGAMKYYLSSPHGITTTREAAVSDVLAHMGPASEPWRYRHLDREAICVGRQEVTFCRWGDGRGGPILLIHDFGGSADDWGSDELLTVMQGSSATFIGIDLPGHHSSWTGELPTLPEVTPILASLISALKLDECQVVGTGLGGIIALHLASRDPRVIGCVAGEVGLGLWQGETVDRRGLLTPNQPRLRKALAHEISPAHDKLLAGHLPSPQGLSRVPLTAQVVARDENLAESRLLAKAMSLRPVLSLPSGVTRATSAVAFLTSALSLLGAQIRHPPMETPPILVAISGLTGVGKSVLAKQAAPYLDAIHLNSDAIRRRLVDHPTYSHAESALVWDDMADQVAAALREKRSVIVDATFSLKNARAILRSWLEDADQLGYRTPAIWLDAELSEIRERVAHRAATSPDWNGSDVAVLDVMQARAAPDWVGNRFDITGMAPKTVFRVALPLLKGSVADVSGWRYLRMQAAMREASDRLLSTGRWPREGSWVDMLLSQIDVDVEEETLDRWGESTLIESNVPLVAECVPIALSARAGQRGTVARVNAGLAHAYACLLSNVVTVHGFSRDRWLDGRISAVLGATRGYIDPAPSRGTLLSNVTRALDAHLAGVPVAWVDTEGTRVTGTLVERDPATGVEFATTVLARERVPYEVLAYSMRAPEPDCLLRYVTVFPVPHGYASVLAGQTRNSGALEPRYNAIPPIEVSNAPAVRVFKPGALS